MADNIFDFGFTAVDENELEVVQKAAKESQVVASTAQDLEDKLNSLYNAILPLLSNLKLNPEKDYIYWPNRVEKVEQFEDHISKIIEG
jgi:predicted phage tail protein